MSVWMEKLREHRLGYTVSGPDIALVRENDPSRNRMVSFVKKAPQQNLVRELSKGLGSHQIQEERLKPSVHVKNTPVPAPVLNTSQQGLHKLKPAQLRKVTSCPGEIALGSYNRA
jgi:hypothetical protein